MATLGLAAAILIGSGQRVPPALESGLELLVAAMLVTLGVLRLRDAARGLHAAPPEHLLADHDHEGAEVVHSHWHHHGGRSHAHPHLHPSRRLAAALGAGRTTLLGRAVAVGAVHGMAGSAAVTLLVLATLPTASAAVAYLTVFGLGTLIGMTALTAAMAWPVTLALRAQRARRALAVCAGCGSIAFGLLYGLRLA
jgi:high-affinity nickel-transport protein